MKILKIVIERSSDMFGAYAENAKGIYGTGDNVQEAKLSVLNGKLTLQQRVLKLVLPESLTFCSIRFNCNCLLNLVKNQSTYHNFFFKDQIPPFFLLLATNMSYKS